MLDAPRPPRALTKKVECGSPPAADVQGVRLTGSIGRDSLRRYSRRARALLVARRPQRKAELKLSVPNSICSLLLQRAFPAGIIAPCLPWLTA